MENPKTKGSGIICCIPQTGICPNKCKDCFFQSGRSYLEPLDDNLPNMPSVEKAEGHKDKFYNTAIAKNIEKFDAPVVLSVNPADLTDKDFHALDPVPANLMFVRARTNIWNATAESPSLVDRIVDYYTSRKVPVILTFMAYFEQPIPEEYEKYYTFRKRTLNSYHAITTAGWDMIMSRYKYNLLVYSCSEIEGELGNFKCERCGNCLREYYATRERMRNT
jgi:hypothetical protein